MYTEFVKGLNPENTYAHKVMHMSSCMALHGTICIYEVKCVHKCLQNQGLNLECALDKDHKDSGKSLTDVMAFVQA